MIRLVSSGKIKTTCNDWLTLQTIAMSLVSKSCPCNGIFRVVLTMSKDNVLTVNYCEIIIWNRIVYDSIRKWTMKKYTDTLTFGARRTDCLKLDGIISQVKLILLVELNERPQVFEEVVDTGESDMLITHNEAVFVVLPQICLKGGESASRVYNFIYTNVKRIPSCYDMLALYC